MKKTLLFVVLLIVCATVALADTVATPAAAAKTEKTVTIQASDQSASEVAKTIADATGETILVEKIVDGKVTMAIKDVTAEKALDALTKALHVQWRKVYVDPSSVVSKDADALASQMRMVLSVKFPDMIVSGPTAASSLAHFQRESAVKDLTKMLPQSIGLKPVYLITDDEKAAKKEIKDESKKKVAKYCEAYKELMDQFIKMSPEERAAVLRESMNMVNQMDPTVLKDMMTSMFEMDPQYVSEMNRVSMQAIFSMSAEARKTMIRNSVRQQMELMNSLSPEQLQELQQEAAAAAAEVMNANNGGNSQ